MHLKQNSKLVGWAELSPWMPTLPRTITLCSFFWRTFFFATISNIIYGVLVVVTAPLWIPLWLYTSWERARREKMFAERANWTKEQWDHYEWELCVAAQDARWQKWDRLARRIENSVFVQGIKTIKGKVCPIIFID